MSSFKISRLMSIAPAIVSERRKIRDTFWPRLSFRLKTLTTAHVRCVGQNMFWGCVFILNVDTLCGDLLVAFSFAASSTKTQLIMGWKFLEYFSEIENSRNAFHKRFMTFNELFCLCPVCRRQKKVPKKFHVCRRILSHINIITAF